MSDSEDDFMSDKFLVEAPVAQKSYSARRDASLLKGNRAGLANNKQTLKVREEQQRREGLATSLFDKKDEPGAAGSGKAMAMMMKMGWKVGEGLGKKQPETEVDGPIASGSGSGSGSGGGIGSKRRQNYEQEDEAPRGGLGSSSRKAARTEPIRISLWSGRKGLTARDPTPPPIPTSNRNPDMLDENKMARLGQKTDQFRERQRMTFKEREDERKEAKARELLVGYDEENGVKFHPLHVMPSDALGTLPYPLLRLIYPAQVSSRSPSPSPPLELAAPTVKDPTISKKDNLSAAERLREQMRKDMLSQLGGEDEGDFRFGVKSTKDQDERPPTKEGEVKRAKRYEGVDWQSMVSGTKKVLTMDAATHLTFLISQLRHEHLFCFWCAYKYKSYDEMEGPGGCPGEEEDDH